MKVRLLILILLVEALVLLPLSDESLLMRRGQLVQAEQVSAVLANEIIVVRASSSPSQNQIATIQPSATATATPTATFPPTATPWPTETPRPPCDRSDPNSVCDATINVFDFVDQVHRGGCDTFYDEGGGDFPLPESRVTFIRSDGGREQKITGSDGTVTFTGIDFLPEDAAIVQIEYPASYQGYPIVSCANSPDQRLITRENFGESRTTLVVFRAKMLLPTPTPTPTSSRLYLPLVQKNHRGMARQFRERLTSGSYLWSSSALAKAGIRKKRPPTLSNEGGLRLWSASIMIVFIMKAGKVNSPKPKP